MFPKGQTVGVRRCGASRARLSGAEVWCPKGQTVMGPGVVPREPDCQGPRCGAPRAGLSGAKV